MANKAEKIKQRDSKRSPEPKAPIYKTTNQYVQYALIALFVFILYGNSIPNDYALDDAIVITDNAFTKKGFEGIKDIFSYDSFKGFGDNYVNSVSGGRYRPLSIATFAIEMSFFGQNPHISHFINVLFYALTCVLLFILLKRMLTQYSNAHWYNTIPFIATLLFAAHPIHTEVVANIKSRDEILSLLFSLITLWLLLQYLDTRKITYLLISPITYFMALLSKEIAITFMIIYPAAFYFFSQHSIKKIAISLIPATIITVVFLIIRHNIISQTELPANTVKDVMNYSFAEMNSSQKWATIVYCLGLYVKLLFIPHPLTWDYYPYHIPIMEWSNPMVSLAMFTYAFMFFLMIKGLKTKTLLSFSIILFLIPLTLVSNIIFPVGAFMSERFVYVSSIGFVIGIAWFCVTYLPKIKLTPALILLPVIFLFSWKTIDRNKAWKDGETIISTDAKVSKNSVKSNAEYGKILYFQAQKSTDAATKAQLYDEVLEYENKAFGICKNQHTTNFILGTIYGRYKNDLQKSIYYLNNAMHLDPTQIESYNNLGIAYAMTKQYEKAVETFQAGLKYAPQDLELLKNLIVTYQFLGQKDKIELYTQKMKMAEAASLKKK